MEKTGQQKVKNKQMNEVMNSQLKINNEKWWQEMNES